MILMLIIIIIGILYIIYSSDNKKLGFRDEESKKCYNCEYEIKENFNYCPVCKAKLKKQCEMCGKMINVNWRYCPYCNHSNLEKEGEI